MFSGNVLRKCYVTSTSFGSIKDQDKSEANKAYYFQNFYARIRSKEDVKQEIKNKNKTVIPWSSENKVQQFPLRLDLIEMKTDYNISLYVQDQVQAQALKNLVIYERGKQLDPLQKKKLQQSARIWKYLQAQYFYKNLQKFLTNKELLMQNEEMNKAVEYNVYSWSNKQKEQAKETKEEFQ